LLQSLSESSPQSRLRYQGEASTAALEALELTETEILDSIDQLGLLSAPLAGFIDHLTIKFQGSHVQPFAKLPGRRVTIGDGSTSSARRRA
jgi:hypothetical protein